MKSIMRTIRITRYASVAITGISALYSLTACAAVPARYQDFVNACTRAFNKSSGEDANEVGRQICECTAKESRHEGVSQAALQSETSRIKADPKHQIQDQKLLNAFHYCAIEMAHES